MGFVGKQPTRAALTEADITDGIIVNADINSSAAIAISKTALSAGTGISLSTNTLNVDAAQTGITSLLATDIKIGEDDQTKIDFEDNNKINFYANNVKEVELAENSLSPGSSDGTALGTTSLMWSDLFLASGGVINLNDGDVTITHASGKLTSTGDLELLRDANDADVKVTLGTSAAESLIIQVLNGGSNKTAEEVHFSTATASATADHGKMVFDIDGTDILTIDDGGLVIKTTGTIGPVGDEDLITLTASGNIVTVAGELSVTTLDIGGTNVGSTAAELNLLDGSAKSTSSITIADSDAFIVIDGTTTKQIPASDIASYAGGGGGGSFDAVANGAISAADLVALEADGKVKKCQLLQTGKAIGNATQFDAQDGDYIGVGFDPDNNKVAVIYRDAGNNGYPTIVIGGVTDAAAGAISFGTPVVVDTGSGGVAARLHTIAYDESVDRFVATWNRSYFGAGGISTVVFYCSNTSTNAITKGSSVVLESGDIGKVSFTTYDASQSKVLIHYENSDNDMCVRVLTVTGGSTNSVAAGSEVVWETSDHSGDGGVGAVYDANDSKTMIVFADTDNSNKMTAVPITVSGTTPSAGTQVVLNNSSAMARSTPSGVVHDPDKNINVVFDENLGAVCFTSSSGSITAGQTTSVTIGSYKGAYYDTNQDKIVCMHGNGSALSALVGFISGTGSDATFVQESNSTIASINASWVQGVFMSGSNKGMALFKDTTNTGYYGLMPNIDLNTSSFIGIANDAISDTATGTITTIGGVATGQSSLSIGSDYYVSNAALTTTSGTVFAGRALTATTLLLGFPRINNTD